jgi:GTP-binding protein
MSNRRSSSADALILSQIKNRTPKVAILGGPNVGKSTLFNRLLGKRRTITDPAPGVTRDPVSSNCTIDDITFELIDTGGYQSNEQDELAAVVSDRSVQTGREASLILLVVDVTQMSSNDEDFVEKLRPFNEKIILVANKADNEKRDALVWNLYRIGFSTVLGVSAAHGRNIPLLKREIYSFLKGNEPSLHPEPEATWTEVTRIAILGKPNTGKSTLLNFLLGEQRSIVSEIPSTTRDVIEGQFLFRGAVFQVLDTAGIRRKSKVRGTVEHYSVSRAISTIKACDIVYLLMDATTGLTDQDKKIASLIVREGKGIVLVLNKWDLMQSIPNQLQAIKDRITFLFPVLQFAPVRAISALTGYGVKELLDLSITVKEQLQRRIPTSTLNQVVAKWIEEYAPPSVKGRSAKIRYATQVSSNPVVFIFFVNAPHRVQDAYCRYLINRIREELGFKWIPLRVEMRSN